MSYHSSRLEISAEALQHNVRVFRSLLAPTVKVVCVIKGNAYGHGLSEVAKALEAEADYWQVDDLADLIELRAVSSKPALILGYIPEAHMQEAFTLGAQIAVYDLIGLRNIEETGKKLARKLQVQLKLDALLGREGVLINDLAELLDELKKCQWIELAGVYAHFANIEDSSDFSYAQKQINEYEKGLLSIKEAGFGTALTHISASSGILAYESMAAASGMVRLGLGMYGLWPSQDLRTRFENESLYLMPALRWVTEVGQVHTVQAGHSIGYGLTYITKQPTKVALIPQGYADGYDRRLSNSGEVLIQGSRCPVLGRVAMNMFVVDVSRLGAVKVGEEVVLLGRQAEECISAEELAEKIGSINYEVVTRISPLLPRRLV